jgi:hypothetical protein
VEAARSRDETTLLRIRDAVQEMAEAFPVPGI